MVAMRNAELGFSSVLALQCIGFAQCYAYNEVLLDASTAHGAAFHYIGNRACSCK